MAIGRRVTRERWIRNCWIFSIECPRATLKTIDVTVVLLSRVRYLKESIFV
jgi:hypothetical protein